MELAISALGEKTDPLHAQMRECSFPGSVLTTIESSRLAVSGNIFVFAACGLNFQTRYPDLQMDVPFDPRSLLKPTVLTFIQDTLRLSPWLGILDSS